MVDPPSLMVSMHLNEMIDLEKKHAKDKDMCTLIPSKNRMKNQTCQVTHTVVTYEWQEYILR